jgi:hypothetical protein
MKAEAQQAATIEMAQSAAGRRLAHDVESTIDMVNELWQQRPRHRWFRLR